LTKCGENKVKNPHNLYKFVCQIEAKWLTFSTTNNFGVYEVKADTKTKNRKQRQTHTYLVVNKISPQPGLSSLVWIRGQQRRLVIPHLINILNSNKRLTDWFPIVNKNWDLLVNWVHLKKHRTLVPQILLTVLILHTLLF
jgi:hypothetical protein